MFSGIIYFLGSDINCYRTKNIIQAKPKSKKEDKKCPKNMYQSMYTKKDNKNNKQTNSYSKDIKSTWNK